MVSKAKVLRTTGETAVVEVERSAACDGCHKSRDGQGCSICSLTGASRKFEATALNRVGAGVGDDVEVETESGIVLWYAALVFLLPVAIGIACFFIAGLLFETEMPQYAALVGGFVLTMFFVWLYARAVGKKRCDVVIVRVFRNQDTDGESEG